MIWAKKISEERKPEPPAPLQHAAYMVVHGAQHTVIDGKTRDRFEKLPEHEAWQKYDELMKGGICQNQR